MLHTHSIICIPLCVPKYNISSAGIKGKMTEINNNAWHFFISEKIKMTFYIKNPKKNECSKSLEYDLKNEII